MKEDSDKSMTIMGVVVGVAAVPVVFVYTMFRLDEYMPWVRGLKINYLHVWLTFFAALAVGIAWSVFAVVGWKRGNPGIRIALTLVVWAFVVGIMLADLFTLMTEAL